MTALLQVNQLTKHYTVRKRSLFGSQRRVVHAADDVTFEINEGQTFGLVGETGCGKTTIAKIVAGLIQPTSGHIYFSGDDIFSLNKDDFRKFRPKMQLIFQDPYASLNPRQTTEDIITMPLRANHLVEKRDEEDKASALLEKVGLSPASNFLRKYPHELSSGQRQRVGIARALALNPRFIIADEPVSALDASIKSQILTLLQKLKKESGVTYFVISHDLATIRYLCTTVAVMHLGKLVELSDSEDIFNFPEHPYTQALLSATPEIGDSENDQKLRLEGELPSPINLPTGCRFHTRCPFAQPKCASEEPQLRQTRVRHFVACHFPTSERN
jgi:oligopeptide/dipeptide ABC transporter ATP-binding protein